MSKLRESLRIGVVSSVFLMCGATFEIASAQQSGTSPSGGTALGPVTVDAPTPRRRVTTAPRRAARPQQVAVAPRRPPVRNPSAPAVENPRGAITGYVAGRSMSGTKTNTPILETPQAISVIGAEQIRDQNPTNLSEILRYAPGVVGGTFGVDPRNDWFLIRGFKTDDNSLFLDGLQMFYTAYASWKLAPANIERVEILRGPSAVLYGGSSQAGLVNVISKMPPAEPIRYMEAGINQYGNRYLTFDFGGPVPIKTDGGGQLFYRLVGQLQSGGTQTDFVKDDNYFIAPSLTWKPDADTTFTLLASAQKSKSNTENFLPYVGTVTASPFGRIPTSFFLGDPTTDHFKREQEMIGYQFERNLTDSMTFRQNARYAHINVDYAGPYGTGYVDKTTLPNGLYVPNSPLIGRSNFFARDIADQANLDNQLEVRFRTGALSHTALFGVDFKYYSIDDTQGFGGPNFSAGAFPVDYTNPVNTPTPAFNGLVYQNGIITQKQVGFYAQDQIKWDRWTLVLSGRNDFVGTNNDNRIGDSQARSDSKFSGRAGLIYTSEIGLAPYVSYATSYNPIIALNNGQLLLPETGEQTEVGIKFAPAGMNGYISAALFDLKRKNALTTDPTNIRQPTQNGEVTSRGIELEMVANLTPEFKMVASFTSYHLFVSQDLDATLIGKTPVNTPQQMASLWGDYTIKTGRLTGLGFGAGVRYRGSSFADPHNQFVVPSAIVGDAAIHYEWDGWRLALNVNNILDKTYVASCSTVDACFYADRRRATASISYKW